MKITDKQIDAIFRSGPFCARETWRALRHKGKYEVVEEIGGDHEVITDEQKHHGFFNDWDEAKKVERRLHVRWVLSHNAEDRHEVKAKP